MIQHDGNYTQIVCDECGKEYPQLFGAGEFFDMIAAAKASGWTVKPDSEGGWTHLCCAPKSRLEKAKALFGKG